MCSAIKAKSKEERVGIHCLQSLFSGTTTTSPVPLSRQLDITYWWEEDIKSSVFLFLSVWSLLLLYWVVFILVHDLFPVYFPPPRCHPAEEQGDTAAWWAGGVQPTTLPDNLHCEWWIPNKPDVTNYRVIHSWQGILRQLFAVTTETQKPNCTGKWWISVLLQTVFFLSWTQDSESLGLRAQLEALITSMGQKVSSSFEFRLGVTGQYQTLVPGFWASLITCLQVSNHPVSFSVTMTTSLLSASWTFPLCCSHLETHSLNNMEII